VGERRRGEWGAGRGVGVRRDQLGKEKKLMGGPRMSVAGEREEGGGNVGGLAGPSRPKREGERREGWISFFISNSFSKAFAI